MGQQVWSLRRGATTQYALRNMYDGEMHRGMRHGFGVFRYANGACYEGEWQHNVKSGKVLTYTGLLFLLALLSCFHVTVVFFTAVFFQHEIFKLSQSIAMKLGRV